MRRLLLTLSFVALNFGPPCLRGGDLLAAPATQPASVKWVGCYSQRASDLAGLRQRWGINFAMHWESESGKVTQRQWRAAAKAAGLKYVDTYLDDGDASDPDLIGWVVSNSDEWNRARGNPPVRPDVSVFVAEARRLAALNVARGSDKLILANADGPSVTTAIFENPPYPGIKNNEKALLTELTWPSIDWYPVMLTAADTPGEIARRPLHLPAQGVWRLKTWADAWGVKHRGYCVILEAAKRWNSPLGVTGAQMREQVDYVTGARPFPVPDARGKAQSFQGPLVDMVVWWTANGRDGPGWQWLASDADQEKAIIDLTAGLLKSQIPPPAPPATREELAAVRAELAAARAEQAAFVEWLTKGPATRPSSGPAQTLRPAAAAATAPATQPAAVPRGRAVSMLGGLDLPADLGMARGLEMERTNFNLQRDPHTGRQDYEHSSPPGRDWWAEMDAGRFRAMTADLPAGSVVSLNFEGSGPADDYGLHRSDAENEAALYQIGRRFRWARSLRPDLLLDWNTAPPVILRDPWRWGDLQADDPAANRNERMRRIARLIQRHVAPDIDSFSTQVYFHKRWQQLDLNLFGQVRDPLTDKNGLARFLPSGEPLVGRGRADPEQLADGGWVDALRSAHEGFAGFGLPVNVMFNPTYEWRSADPALIGTWITGEDLTAVQKYLRAFGMGVLLWGEPKSDAPVVNQPGDVHYRWDPRAREWGEWVRWSAKQN